MDMMTWTPDGRPPVPPPLWLVSSGLRTVGPVSTHNLVRSAKVGGVPDDLWARDVKAVRWRALDDIREIRALGPAGGRPCLEEARLEALLGLADEQDEALDLALRLAATKLGATAGFVHVFSAGDHVATTQLAIGRGATARLGARLPGNDGLAHVARTRNLALGHAGAHEVFRAAARRLGGDAAEVVGVAMVPIALPRGATAMVELGREDHRFRAADAAALRGVAARVTGRLTPRRRAR